MIVCKGCRSMPVSPEQDVPLSLRTAAVAIPEHPSPGPHQAAALPLACLVPVALPGETWLRCCYLSGLQAPAQLVWWDWTECAIADWSEHSYPVTVRTPAQGHCCCWVGAHAVKLIALRFLHQSAEEEVQLQRCWPPADRAAAQLLGIEKALLQKPPQDRICSAALPQQ